MIGQDPEMLQMFLEESNEHLSNLEPDLLTLEDNKETPDKNLINRIFRAVHSLKGSAGFFGFDNITKLSHSMENLLSLVRDGKLKPHSKMISSLLTGTDQLVQMIEDIDNSEELDCSATIIEIENHAEGKPNPEDKIKLEFEAVEDLPTKIAEQFELTKSELKNAIVKGHFLYSVHAYTHKDMKDKNKTPLNYLNEIQKLGNLIGSYSDISTISTIDDIHDKDIAFVFLFSSVLEPDLISVGLEVDESQIEELKFPELIEKKKGKKKPIKPIGPDRKEKKEVKKAEKIKDSNKPPKTVIDKEKTVVKQTKKTTNVKVSTVKNAPKESLRVQVSLLNDLMTLAGEMVLARNQLMRMASDVAKTVPGLQNVLQDINMTTTILQEKIMNTRMQSISIVFNKFPRVIRDMQKLLSKKIKLEISGNEVELDKSIIENLSDPLTHLIRNSADHAIGLPDERQAAGKNPEGTIKLKAYHEGGKVNIDVIDDGRGMNPAIIAQKAIEKGIISEAEADSLSDKECLNLIFAPGFSTAQNVSSISGRGVGMDVVRTNIEKLGGSVSIDSQIGKGTSINLKLPLTLAIIPSLIVTTQDMNFALPQVALREIVRIKKNDPNLKIEKVNDAPVLRLRKKLLPIIYLEDVLGLKKDKIEREILRVLVLQHDENIFGLVVDEIFDSEEIVVKSIPRFFKNSLAYSGTTIMGDGSVALILDIAGIAVKSKLQFGLDKSSSLKDEEEINAESQNLLLFENAKNEFFALNLDLIKRIEKVSISNIDKVGDKEYIKHEGKSLLLVRLERFLPVKPIVEGIEIIYIIIPKLLENPIGIVTSKIIDSIVVETQIDTESITSNGIIGSSLIDGKIILFPDIYEIMEMALPEKSMKYQNFENNKIKILLVEDTPFFRTLEKQYLESAGYYVDLATDGLDGFKKAQQTKYDLFVVDIVMPRMDGFEFVKTIRQSNDYETTPIVAVTTLNNEESKAKAFEAGFSAYEIKVNKEKLLHTISTLLR